MGVPHGGALGALLAPFAAAGVDPVSWEVAAALVTLAALLAAWWALGRCARRRAGARHGAA
jgi:hypothetical protein